MIDKAFIFARGGSKGVLKKNIRPLGGKPLIAWSIEAALATKYIECVYVSTDCPEIAEVAEQYGACVPFMRPSSLAEDTSSEWDAWRHALSELEQIQGVRPEVLVSVPATAPLRKSSDIDDCIRLFLESDADIVFTVTPASHNPWFNMVRVDDALSPSIVIEADSPVTRRQDAPKCFDITTVCYVAKSQYIMNYRGLFQGVAKVVEVPLERAVDIDTEIDFALAEYLLNKRLGTYL